MKLQKIVNRLQKLHPKEIDLSLNRIKKLCKTLGNPQDKLKAISVERNDDRIFFRADGINDYDSVMKIMGALSGAGFPNISLVTDTN